MYLLILIIIFLFFLILSHTNFGNNKFKNNLSAKFITVGREKIRYKQKGKGKDVLLIHGTPGSIDDWNSVFDALAKKYRVTAFDRLGHGYSSSNDYSYHIKDNALLTEKLISKLNLKSPLVVGHSYGGSIVAYLAVNSSIKVNYVIIDSPLYSYKADVIYKLATIPVFGKLLALISSFTIAKKQIKDGVSVLFQSLDDERINELVVERQKLWKQPKIVYSKSKESVNYETDLVSMSDKYKDISSKMTIVTANDLYGTYNKDCIKFHSEVVNSELIIIEDSGHYIQIEKPQKIINLIENNA